MFDVFCLVDDVFGEDEFLSIRTPRYLIDVDHFSALPLVMIFWVWKVVRFENSMAEVLDGLIVITYILDILIVIKLFVLNT